MKNTKLLAKELISEEYQERLREIYVDEGVIPYQIKRYQEAIQKYEELFGEQEVEIYSAPGRSEVGGNHTDHQHGEVLAASINLDAIAVVSKSDNDVIKLKSEGYPMITMDLKNLEVQEEDEGTSAGLIRGMAYGLKKNGYKIGGFCACVTSDVLNGAGMSSSAAFEVLVGTIFSGLYNDMSVSPVEIALAAQYAENVYFGKPCGLMDQMACSVGSLVHIDFGDAAKPVVEKVEFDLDKAGYSLCITDTKGSHVNLTADYAAIPAEMKAVAGMFGKEVLTEVSEDKILTDIPQIRQALGDRALLRALHFYEENKRVMVEVNALKTTDIKTFLDTVKASGASSFQYLQNVYTNHDITSQNMSVALAVSDITLGSDGTSRVHGGGFAGTIQAFVKNTAVETYKKTMDAVFGEDSCKVLKIRKYGGMKVL